MTSDTIQLMIAVSTAFAAVISLSAVIISTRQNSKINNSVLKQNEQLNTSGLLATFYVSIFRKYLTRLIPEARRKIRFNNSKIDDVAELLKTLNKMLQDAVFFKYQNNEFYKDLKTKTRKLESYISDASNKTFVDDSDEGKIKEEINNLISDIYSTICKSFTNTR